MLLRRRTATTHNRRGIQRHTISNMPRQLNVIVRKLAELAVVHTNFFVLGADAEGETGDEVHEEEDDAGECKGPAEGGADAGELVAELDPVVLDPADGGVGAAVEGGDGGAVKKDVREMGGDDG